MTSVLSFHPYLLQTLSKWSSKIQAVAPSVLLPSNRGAFSKGAQNPKSVVQLIDDTLREQDKLLKRTQVPRVKKARIGVVQQEENVDAEDIVDPDVFDDTDFYQKMLRDIIDARGNGNKNEDWMLLQKQKKAKKKVDTKASKGRKLRFVCSFFILYIQLTDGVVMRFMKNCKISWFPSLYPELGTMNKSTNCSLLS